MEFGHEIISSQSLLLLIQGGQLSVTGQRMCTIIKVLVNCLGGLPRNSVDGLTDHDLKSAEGP